MSRKLCEHKCRSCIAFQPGWLKRLTANPCLPQPLPTIDRRACCCLCVCGWPFPKKSHLTKDTGFCRFRRFRKTWPSSSKLLKYGAELIGPERPELPFDGLRSEVPVVLRCWLRKLRLLWELWKLGRRGIGNVKEACATPLDSVPNRLGEVSECSSS
mmetsp:Transcript_42630/g.79509  ORF Transcript_42630/g.79509 Transcript_42630/m.79509 type:complete len:157 (+) Transcript_42630:94-564(+)